MVMMSKWYPDWKSALVIVKPETVIGWHKTWSKFIWKRKSQKRRGRPKISMTTIAMIKRIHKGSPLLSPEKIHELLVNLNVTDAPAPNTIAKYFPATRKPPSEKQLQSWITFLQNELLWSMDLFTVVTIRFQVLYVLIIMSHSRRRIEQFGVTAHPTAAWVAQQIRNATPFGKQPKYLLHDNDSIFTSMHVQDFLTNANIKSVRTAYRSPWQNGICERAVGIIRREVLDHIIPFSERHLHRVLHQYIHKYYNPHRTHQGIGCQTPDRTPCLPKTTMAETTLISTKVLGGLYHTYTKAA
jgi:transposase InsO family protein